MAVKFLSTRGPSIEYIRSHFQMSFINHGLERWSEGYKINGESCKMVFLTTQGW